MEVTTFGKTGAISRSRFGVFVFILISALVMAITNGCSKGDSGGVDGKLDAKFFETYVADLKAGEFRKAAFSVHVSEANAFRKLAECLDKKGYGCEQLYFKLSDNVSVLYQNGLIDENDVGAANEAAVDSDAFDEAKKIALSRWSEVVDKARVDDGVDGSDVTKTIHFTKGSDDNESDSDITIKDKIVVYDDVLEEKIFNHEMVSNGEFADMKTGLTLIVVLERNIKELKNYYIEESPAYQMAVSLKAEQIKAAVINYPEKKLEGGGLLLLSADESIPEDVFSKCYSGHCVDVIREFDIAAWIKTAQGN